MCFYNSMTKKATKVAARYNRQLTLWDLDEIDPMYKITAFADPRCLIVTAEADLKLFYWGLIPFWVKSEEQAEEIHKGTYNARSETIFEKPSFRVSIKSKRCIVPSTGYFEWHHIFIVPVRLVLLDKSTYHLSIFFR